MTERYKKRACRVFWLVLTATAANVFYIFSYYTACTPSATKIHKLSNKSVYANISRVNVMENPQNEPEINPTSKRNDTRNILKLETTNNSKSSESGPTGYATLFWHDSDVMTVKSRPKPLCKLAVEMLGLAGGFAPPPKRQSVELNDFQPNWPDLKKDKDMWKKIGETFAQRWESKGNFPVDKTYSNLFDVRKMVPQVQKGGRYSPPGCTALHKVAIIVPYRNRPRHLAVFLKNMHQFLMQQKIDYGIYIVEQNGKGLFNRAKLFNVGFVEAQRLTAHRWECFIFHDIDLLPLDSRNLYSCPKQPRHMSIAIDYYNFQLPYDTIFGGISAMTVKQFTRVNGFSNMYWGWGGEDDDMYERLEKKGYHIGRYPMSIGRYTSLQHDQSPPNPKRHDLLSNIRKQQNGYVSQVDGLSTLEYRVLHVSERRLFTHILTSIDLKDRRKERNSLLLSLIPDKVYNLFATAVKPEAGKTLVGVTISCAPAVSWYSRRTAWRELPPPSFTGLAARLRTSLQLNNRSIFVFKIPGDTLQTNDAMLQMSK